MKVSAKYIQTIFMLSLFLIFSGCENTITKPEENDDDQLIQGIIEAQKINVSISDLPSYSVSIIERDYSNYIEISANMALDLGYQVSMDGKDYRTGHHNEIYFDLKGRKLKSKRNSRKEEGLKCFELIFPITFIMPDASSIIIEEDDDYAMLRYWYANNLDTEVKPVLEYPVNIIYKDGNTEIVNNSGEMQSKKINCRDWDKEEKDWECFSIVYPITFNMPDGSIISMSGYDDWTDLKNWYGQNSDIKEYPAINYPIQINYKDGSNKLINSDEEMSAAKQSCRY